MTSRTIVRHRLVRQGLTLGIAVLLGLGSSLALGQAATAPAAKKPPDPEDIRLTTRDGVELEATYYAGTKGKETVPVMLVHTQKGNRRDYTDLAVYLQLQGHAVLSVDLRGHGGSRKLKSGERDLDANLMSPDHYLRTIDTDMETFKAFLMARNNAGELNIEKLCVVGAEMGAIVALEWARMDWSWPPLATGKQGQDVKALVLISPAWSVPKLKLGMAMNHPAVQKNLSILMMVGNGDSRSVREAQRMHTHLKKFRPDPPEDRRAELQDLFFAPLETSLQGTKMLEAMPKAKALIARFITLRLEEKSEFAWRAR